MPDRVVRLSYELAHRPFSVTDGRKVSAGFGCSSFCSPAEVNILIDNVELFTILRSLAVQSTNVCLTSASFENQSLSIWMSA